MACFAYYSRHSLVGVGQRELWEFRVIDHEGRSASRRLLFLHSSLFPSHFYCFSSDGPRLPLCLTFFAGAWLSFTIACSVSHAVRDPREYPRTFTVIASSVQLLAADSYGIKLDKLEV